MGVPKHNIEVTGIPRYEYFYKQEVNRLNEIRDIFNKRSYVFKENEVSILLTTNPIDDISNERIITNVVNSLKELDLIENLIIKLHPRENGSIHKRILKKLNVSPIVIKDYKILDTIKSCDLLLSQKSTTILEAMLVGTPLILLDFINKSFKETSKYQFLDEQYVITVKDQDTLTEKIDQLISNKSLRRTYIENLKDISQEFLFYDPKAPPIHKITKLILKIVKNS
jgi:UDP-N-acetylglucosamine:LPS N-acetylglucosamine transferase